MTSPRRFAVSVREDAVRDVEPDSAVVRLSIRAVADSVDEAAAVVENVRLQLVAALEEFGGAPLTSTNVTDPLTWSVGSLHTGMDHENKFAPRHAVSLTMAISVRRFDLLVPLTRMLTRDDHISVYSVRWLVDRDNPAWREVRAEAIRAALHRAGDYAAALGGRVTRIEHIADAGLLGGQDGAHQAHPLAFRASALHSEESATPSLDPALQEMRAVIEARVEAEAADLDLDDLQGY